MSESLPPPEETDEFRMAELLDRFHRDLEEGLDPDPASFQAQSPRLAEELAQCLEGLGALQELKNQLLPPQESASFQPRLLGDFELLREIGRGGMGVVYQARQLSLPRTVALKVLRGGTQSTHQERQRFRFEVEAAARLDHPGIVRILEVNDQGEEPYFTMEFVAGSSLSRRLEEGPLPVRDACALVRQVAEAIEHAHERGVLHRDLKPSNILLDEHERPRVTDFGLAKRLDADSSLTQTGAVMGTPSYMAPEQAAGKTAEVGPRSDVHALGAILYECLTGRPPFRGATVTETLHQVQNQEPVPPEKLNYHIPFELSTICLKCLHKDAGRRYGSAGESAADLQAFLDGRPIKARPDSLLYRFYRAVKQEPFPDIMHRHGPAEIAKGWVSLLVCVVVTGMRWFDVPVFWIYALLMSGGFILVYWQSPGREDTLVERQVQSVWQAFFLGCIVTALLDMLMAPPRPLYFSPVIAVLAGVANFVVADMLSGWFYFGALACFAGAIAMVYAGNFDFLILGLILFLTLVVPGYKYRDRR